MSASAAARARREPSPRVAAALSIVPGLGQVWVGQPRKAPHYLIWTVLLIGGSVALLTWAVGFGHDLLASGAVTGALLLALGSIVAFLTLFISGLYVWASAAVDAWTSARELRAGETPSAERRRFRL